MTISDSSTPVLILISRFWSRHGWKVIAGLWVVAAGLGMLGFALNAPVNGRTASPLDLAYRTLQLIPMNSGDVDNASLPLNAARFLVPFLAAWTAVRAFLALFRDRWQQVLVRFWGDHVVICGLSRKGWLLAQGFVALKKRVVVIEADESHDLIGPCRERGIPVFTGDATDPDLLGRAGAVSAHHVIAVTDNDGINAEISVRCHDLLKTRRRSRPSDLTCTVHLVDPELYELARARELALEEEVPLRLELFNVFERGARLLWRDYGPATAHDAASAGSAPVVAGDAGSGGGAASCSYHALLIGLGSLGESLIVHAARDWHSRIHETPCRAAGRLRFTVVDIDAERKCEALHERYPQLRTVCDFAPWTMNVNWPDFYAGRFLVWATEGPQAPAYPPISTVFVCFDDDSLGLRTGLRIYEQLLKRGDTGTPVVVRMAESSGLARLVSPANGEPPANNGAAGNGAEAAHGTFAGLHAFPLLDRTCTPEAVLGGTHEVLARALHEVYLNEQQALGRAPASDPALATWDVLSPVYRESSGAEVRDLLRHLGELGYAVVPLTDWDAAGFRFPPDDVEKLAEREHERWFRERVSQGWTYTRGPRNEVEKKSPSLVHWDQAGAEERRKTLKTVSELPATLARAGFQIIPLPGGLSARRQHGAATHDPDPAGKATGTAGASVPQAQELDAQGLIARALHERYRQNQQGVKPSDDPAMQPWDSLPQQLRDSNLSSASGITAALAAVGYGIRPAVPGSSPVVFDKGEVETMSAIVHRQWVDERQDHGWVPGPRDVANKSTPYLVPYDDLTDDVKEWDRQLVRAIPEVLAAANLEVHRL